MQTFEIHVSNNYFRVLLKNRKGCKFIKQWGYKSIYSTKICRKSVYRICDIEEFFSITSLICSWVCYFCLLYLVYVINASVSINANVYNGAHVKHDKSFSHVKHDKSLSNVKLVKFHSHVKHEKILAHVKVKTSWKMHIKCVKQCAFVL